MRKKLTAVGMSICIFFLLCLPVQASYYPCDACGAGTVWKSYTATEWIYGHMEQCKAVSGQYDDIYLRELNVTEECDHCHVVYNYNLIQSQVRCFH